MIFLSYVWLTERQPHDAVSEERQRKDKLAIKRQRSRRQCRQPNRQICHAAHDRDVILRRTVTRTFYKNTCPHETKKRIPIWCTQVSLVTTGDSSVRSSLELREPTTGRSLHNRRRSFKKTRCPCLWPSRNITVVYLRHDGVTDIPQLRKQVLAHGEPHLMVTFILPLCSRLLLAQLRQRFIDLPFHLVEFFNRVTRQVNVHPADVPCDVMLPPHCYCHPLNHSTRFISVEPSVLKDPTAYGSFIQCHSTQRRRQQIDLKSVCCQINVRPS